MFEIFDAANALYLVVGEGGITWSSCDCAATQFASWDEAKVVCDANAICDHWIKEI